MKENKRYKIGGICFIILGIATSIILWKFKLLKEFPYDYDLVIFPLFFILLGIVLYIISKKVKNKR